MFVLRYFIQVSLSGVSSARKGNISRLALCLVRIALKQRCFPKPTFIGLKSGASCTTYLTSLSQEYLTSHKVSQTSIYMCLNYRCGGHLKLEDLLYSQKYSHSIRVLHYCCLVLAANVGATIEQYRSRIGCHNNFAKAKDAFSRVRDRFWNMFYLHVFYLPTVKDVFG